MKQLAFILAIICIGASSCKHLVPYTDNLSKAHGWTKNDHKHIQFLLSQSICLERKLVSDYVDKIEGKIITKNGVKTEQIFLRKHLPVAYAGTTQDGTFLIKCKVGADNTLTFGINPDDGGKYTLLASEWTNGYGKVHYNDVEFFVSNENGVAHLLVDLRHKLDTDDSCERLKGVKVK